MEIGIQSGHPDRVLVDTCLMQGLDFLWLDAEHTDLTPREVEAIVARARGRSTAILVRVPSSHPDTLLTYANTGVDEVVVPRIEGIAELAECRRLLTYPPGGVRPRQVAPGSGFGTAWRADIRVSAIVETTAAYDAASELARSGLTDALWIGTKDLLDAFQAVGRPEGNDIDATVDALAGLLLTEGATVGIGATDVEGIARARGLGAHRCSVYWERYIIGCIANLLEVREPSPHRAAVGPVAKQ